MKFTKKRIIQIFTLMLIAVLSLTNLVGVVYAGQNSGAISTEIKVTNITDVAKSLADQYQLVADDSQMGLRDDDELVWAVVTLNKKSVLDSALQYNATDYTQYLTTYAAQEETKVLTAYQNKFLAKYSGVIKDVSYRYTTLLNGFAVQLRYGDIGLLESDKEVDSVILSERYLAPMSSITQNEVDVYLTGIYDSSDVEYDGTGTVIAVLDTGLDHTHSAFQLQPTGKLALEKDRVASLMSSFRATQMSADNGDQLTADDLYYSDKIPFAYDYADKDADVYPAENHGTHVAGIIGGKDDQITGVATNAQLAIFKVFSNYKEGADTEDILAALNDCVVLGVDAINMSLGTSCGFSRESDDEATNEIYDKISQTGICLIAAASNDYSSTMQSPNGDTGLTSNPDTGTVGSPSSYEASMSVASIAGVKTKYVMVNNEQLVYYTEAGNKPSEEKHDFAKELLNGKESGTFEYVVVPGLGTESNYYDLDVTGKVAVIKRGTTSFEEKITLAESKGAIAVIVYNNVSGTISMSVGKAKIPAVSVSMDFGKYFEEHTTGTLTADVEYLAGPFMSDFSSWGPLGDLELKPDITAHGGEIYSAVRGGYDVLSGTSMASPNMAGATILVRQYVKETFPTMSAYDVTQLTYRLLMSTATIAYNEDGNPYSPRKQGAGLADINKSVNTNAYIYVEGENKTKLSLGDDPDKTGVYNLVFNVHNLSDQALSYEINPIVMTETLSTDYKTVAQKAYLLGKSFQTTVEGQGGQVQGNTLLVAGYADVKVTVTVTLDDEAKAYLDETFANGMYVEGYVELLSQNQDGINLNIPYLGFYGDWSVAPMLDVTAFEVGAEQEDSSILEEDKLHEDVYATIPMGGFRYYTNATDYEDGYYGLAQFAYKLADGQEAPATIEAKASISNSYEAVYSLAIIGAGLLRNAKQVDMRIEDSVTGEIIWEDTRYDVRKSYYSGGRRPGYLQVEFEVPDYNLANNSKYRFSMECYLDWHTTENNQKNTFTFEFYIDNEAPVLVEEKTQIRVEYANGRPRYLLDMYVYDNHYLQAYILGTYSDLDATGDYNDYVAFHNYVIPVHDGKFNSETRLTYDITNYWDEIHANGGKLVLQTIDYARNKSIYSLTLPNSIADKLAFKSTKRNVNIRANTVEDLKEFLVTTPTDLYVQDLIWTVDDPTVAIVKDGVILGLKEGNTTLRVTNKDGSAEATLPVIITAARVQEIALSKIRLNKNSARIVRGEEIELSATLLPHELFADQPGLNFTDTEVTWSTSGGVLKFVTTDDNGNEVYVDKIVGAQDVKIRAMKSGSGTIRVTSTGGSYVSASCSISVKNEFEMEGSILTQYHGRGDENGVVEIPEDLGVMWIYEQAFMDNDYITKIIVPEGVEQLMEAAIYGCDNLEEVVLPQSMKKLDKWAIAWNSKLTKVDLGGVDTIGDMTFVMDESLTEINLSNVSLIGPRAFAYCDGLQTVDISNCKSMGEQAFLMCKNISNVITGEDTVIGNYAFYGCDSIVNLELNGKNLNTFAFAFCKGLQSVTFNNPVDVIDVGAFYSCSALTDVTYRSTVRVIESAAFADCALTTVFVPDGVEHIGDQAFALLSDQTALYGGPTEVVFSAGAKLQTVGHSLFSGCNQITTFTVEEGNSYLTSVDGILYDKALTTLVLMPTMYRDYKVTVPSSVTTIGEYAFANNQAILTLTAPGVTRIEEAAFASSRVQSFNLGGVTYVGEYAFNGSTGFTIWPTCLNSLQYIGNYAFASTGLSGNIKLPASVNYLGEGAFASTQITSATLYDIEYVSDWAFASCANLQSVTFDDSCHIETIGEYAFADCPSLKQFVMPNTVTTLGEYVFAFSTNLQSVQLSTALTEIPEAAFLNTAITTLTLPSSVTKIGASAFVISSNGGIYEGTLTSINLDNVTEIGAFAFAGTTIAEINAPILTKIGEGAFAYSKTTKFVLPSLVEIGDLAFEGSAIVELVAPSVEKVGAFAFSEAVDLKALDLSNATEIGDFAFFGATSLQSVALDSVQQLGSGAFANTAVTSLAFTSSLTQICEQAFLEAHSLATVTISADNEVYFVDQYGVIYKNNPNGTLTLVSYPAGLALSTYTAEERTVRVDATAFAYNTKLQQLILPERLKVIGAAAFAGCSGLQRITFNSVDAPVLEMFYDPLLDMSNHYYDNFQNTNNIGTTITLAYPANGAGYNGYVWTNFFGERLVQTETISRTSTTIDMSDRLSAMVIENLGVQDIDEVTLLRRIYTSLDNQQKQFLQNVIGKLDLAETQLGAVIVAMIDALPTTVTLEDKQTVTNIRNYYNKLNSEIKAKVTNLDKLTQAEENLRTLAQTPQQTPPTEQPTTQTFPWWWIVIGVAVAGAAAFVVITLIKKKGSLANQQSSQPQENTQKEEEHE